MELPDPDEFTKVQRKQRQFALRDLLADRPDLVDWVDKTLASRLRRMEAGERTIALKKLTDFLESKLGKPVPQHLMRSYANFKYGGTDADIKARAALVRTEGAKGAEDGNGVEGTPGGVPGGPEDFASEASGIRDEEAPDNPWSDVGMYR